MYTSYLYFIDYAYNKFPPEGFTEEVFNKYDVEILSVQKIKNNRTDSYTFKLFSRCKDASSKETILNELCKIENVHEVYTSKRFYRQDAEWFSIFYFIRK